MTRSPAAVAPPRREKMEAMTESLPPFPPFTLETALQKVQAAEDAWNTCDPERVSRAYTVDSQWRNRSEHVVGREEIVAFLTRKWQRELDYSLRKELVELRRTTASRCGSSTSAMTQTGSGTAATATSCGNSRRRG